MFRRSLPSFVCMRDGRVASSRHPSPAARVTADEAGAVMAEYVVLIAGVALIGLGGLLLQAASTSRAFNQAGDTVAAVSVAGSGTGADHDTTLSLRRRGAGRTTAAVTLLSSPAERPLSFRRAWFSLPR